jgi:YD repeat-containing protein
VGCQSSEGVIKSVEVIEYNAHDDSIKRTRSESYDKNGQLINEIYKAPEVTVYKEVEYSYKKDRLISKRITANGSVSEAIYTYDTEFKKVEFYVDSVLREYTIFQYSNEKDRTITTYDDNGDIIRENVEVYLKDDFLEMTSIDNEQDIEMYGTIQFDSENQPIEHISVYEHDGKKQKNITRTTYDEHGNRISIVNNDENTTYLSYVYDDYDNIVEMKVYSDDDYVILFEKRTIKYW